MKKGPLSVLSVTAILVATGCSHTGHKWQAEHTTTLSGFNVPECALYAPDTGITYISNIESKPEEYWTDDAKGYISVLGRENTVTAKRWVESKPTVLLHAPKGMCLLGEHLYFTDNTRLMRCNRSGKHIEILATGFKQANDLATDGKSIWLSDTAAGKIFSISPEGDKREIMAPTGINGITFSGKKMFGVSWDLHEVYELDPSGKQAPVAFGLAEHFKNLDGIEVLHDGTFIVSDFMGNTVYAIHPDRSSAKTLIEIPSPADIGLNRKDGLLYVPQFMKDKVSVYRIENTR
jgi:sugar lactone lactonase YvrE